MGRACRGGCRRVGGSEAELIPVPRSPMDVGKGAETPFPRLFGEGSWRRQPSEAPWKQATSLRRLFHGATCDLMVSDYQNRRRPAHGKERHVSDPRTRMLRQRPNLTAF